MNTKQFIAFVFYFCTLLPGIAFAEEDSAQVFYSQFKLETGYTNYDLEVGADTSAQPLSFAQDTYYGAVDMQINTKRLFISGRYLMTLPADIDEETFSQDLFGQGNRTGDFDHNQWRIRVGYQVKNTFSIYIGYEQSQTDLTYKLNFPDAGLSNPNLSPSDKFRIDSAYEFRTSGPLIGMGYMFNPKDTKSFFLLNLDISELDGKLDNTSNTSYLNGAADSAANNTSALITDRSAVAARVGLNYVYLFDSNVSVKINLEVQQKDFGFNSENLYFVGFGVGY